MEVSLRMTPFAWNSTWGGWNLLRHFIIIHHRYIGAIRRNGSTGMVRLSPVMDGHLKCVGCTKRFSRCRGTGDVAGPHPGCTSEQIKQRVPNGDQHMTERLEHQVPGAGGTRNASGAPGYQT